MMMDRSSMLTNYSLETTQQALIVFVIVVMGYKCYSWCYFIAARLTC